MSIATLLWFVILLNVSPSLPMNDETDLAIGYAVFIGQLPLRDASSCVAFADRTNLVSGELGVVMRFPRLDSPFFPCVLHVFQLGSQEEMGWVDAGGIIPARAVVQNLQSLRNGADAKFPGNTMGQIRDILDVELSIASMVEASGPEPARPGFIDVLPESFHQGNGMKSRPLQIAAFLGATRSPSTSSLVPFDRKFFSALRTDRMDLRHDSRSSEERGCGRAGKASLPPSRFVLFY